MKVSVGLCVSYAQNTSVTQCISAFPALSFHCLLCLCLPWCASKNYTVSCLSCLFFHNCKKFDSNY